MDSNKVEYSRAYSPYRKEALYCFIVDILILIVSFIVIFSIKLETYTIQLLWIIPVYLIAEVFLNYRLALLSLIEEKCRGGTVLATVEIKRISRESSLSGRWESVIPKLYPKEMRVERYKINCTDPNGKKIVLRRAMSMKNAQLFDKMIECDSMRRRTVVIGKYSHIIVKYCDKDDFAFILSRRL